MLTIRYLGPGRFTDHGRDFEALPGSDHDLPDDQAAAYLNHELFGDRWERVDTPDDAGSSTAPDDRDADSEDGGRGDGEDDEDEDDASDASEIDGSEEADSGSKSNDDFIDLDKVGDAKAEDLRDAGYASFADLDDASVDELSDVDGVSQSLAENIDEQINEDHA